MMVRDALHVFIDYINLKYRVVHVIHDTLYSAQRLGDVTEQPYLNGRHVQMDSIKKCLPH